jgi:hypothetical protein
MNLHRTYKISSNKYNPSCLGIPSKVETYNKFSTRVRLENVFGKVNMSL